MEHVEILILELLGIVVLLILGIVNYMKTRNDRIAIHMNTGKDQVVIKTQFNGTDSVSFTIKPRIKKKTHLIAFILALPILVKKLTGSYEAGARHLVENTLISKEEMRKILELSIQHSIEELNNYLDTVKEGNE